MTYRTHRLVTPEECDGIKCVKAFQESFTATTAKVQKDCTDYALAHPGSHPNGITEDILYGQNIYDIKVWDEWESGGKFHNEESFTIYDPNHVNDRTYAVELSTKDDKRPDAMRFRKPCFRENDLKRAEATVNYEIFEKHIRWEYGL